MTFQSGFIILTIWTHWVAVDSTTDYITSPSTLGTILLLLDRTTDKNPQFPLHFA